MRTIISIILLVASIGLFVLYINPVYTDIKIIQAEVASYDAALSKSKDLQRIRDALLNRYNSFSADDLTRLGLLLPDTVDNIRLVLDIDTVASHYGVVIKDLQLAQSSPIQDSFNPGNADVKSVDLSFSVSTEYATFLKFIRDLEDSLRVIDITEIDLSTSDKLTTTYKVTVRTYWLP